MKNRYTIEVLKYDGSMFHREIEADNILIENGIIKFISGTTFSTSMDIAIYPADKTIITRIQKIN